MIKIAVPATSANLGPGFDTLGIALNLYNNFYFEKADEWNFDGFQPDYRNIDNNLVAQSALAAYKYANATPIPLKMSLEENVPNSRGLGSSATCIVAGIKAANYFMGNVLSDDELLEIATEIEGHPDNVAPAIFGNLVSGIKAKKVMKVTYDVCKALKFIVCIPNFRQNTRESRKVLPKTMSYVDVVHNASRLVNIPHALSSGNIELLNILLDDKMHEPYRLPLINDSMKIKQVAKKNSLPFCLSGSGPTLLIIAKNDGIICELEKLKLIPNWRFISLEASCGATITEV